MNKRAFIKVLLLPLLLVGIWSCSEDCSDCDVYNEPDSATLVIETTDRVGAVPVVVMRNKIESNDTVWYGLLTQTKHLTLEANKTYAAVAEYYEDGNTIKVVDEADAEYSTISDCDPKCYKLEANELDLTLQRTP